MELPTAVLVLFAIIVLPDTVGTWIGVNVTTWLLALAPIAVGAGFWIADREPVIPLLAWLLPAAVLLTVGSINRGAPGWILVYGVGFFLVVLFGLYRPAGDWLRRLVRPR